LSNLPVFKVTWITTTGYLLAVRMPNHATHFFNGLDAAIDPADKTRFDISAEKPIRCDHDRVVLAECALERIPIRVGLADAWLPTERAEDSSAIG
jgi:hypothetical protein